jgi:DNA-binding GntR family transcriptional regulator
VVDRLARELRSAIQRGDILPGERIRQQAIARAHNTSRIPVREALRQLATEGLITLEPNVGARVAKLHLEELVEVFLLRERLEPLAVSMSAPNLSTSDLDALRKLVAAMEPAANPANLAPWLKMSREFHTAIYGAAEMPRLLALIESLWNTMDRYRHWWAALPERVDLAQVEHRLVFEAIDRRDHDAAAQLIEIHIRRARLTLSPRR